MTTDAPPERMMLEPCPFCGADAQVLGEDETHGGFYVACLGPDCRCAMGEGYDRDAMPDHHYLDKEAAIEAWNRREAARRLSAPNVIEVPRPPFDVSEINEREAAPAPAAPRVGDDATGLEQWTDAEAIAGLRGDAADIHGRRLHMLANRMRDAAARIERLSAPPAASADERELDDVIHEVQETVIGHIDTMYPGMWQAVAKSARLSVRNTIGNKLRSILPGYRKLAPAQSVGQSAAQGVGMEEIAKWCEAEAANSDAEASRLLGDGLAMAGNVHLGRAVAFEITAAHIRRLSALPKGQEHE